MKVKKIFAVVLGALLASTATAWEANVLEILQHGSVVAVYLSPDPGPGACQYGQPYLLPVSDSEESRQRFAMILTAVATGQKIVGYSDGCSNDIWSQSRPIIWRLILKAN
jgi:hypothetical protein